MATHDPIIYPPLTVMHITDQAASKGQPYRNVVLSQINDSCLRIAAFEGEYFWHYHSSSDELFIVVQGILEIDFEDGSTLRLSAWDAITIPARTVHRTRAIGRTVNLTIEHLAADTVVVDRSAM
jgi:mannose-6-phosphate isomerase-like protein (cupin superfamily)